MKYQVELIGKDAYLLGEGPYYDARYKRLSWVDIVGKKLWMMQDGKRESVDLPQLVGAAIPMAESDGFIVALQDGLYQYQNGELKPFVDLKHTYKEYWRSNDAKADAKGRIFFGAIVEGDGHEPEGGLYCYDKGETRCLIGDTKLANGMAWSSDQKKFYFSDSAEHAVFAFDYDVESGAISNRKTLFTVEDGVPDGMTIDAEDNLWVAIWGGSRVEKRSGRTGELLDTIKLPAKQVTSCCFGDEDWMTLYITSAQVGLDGAFDGCLFQCRVVPWGRG